MVMTMEKKKTSRYHPEDALVIRQHMTGKQLDEAGELMANWVETIRDNEVTVLMQGWHWRKTFERHLREGTFDEEDFPEIIINNEKMPGYAMITGKYEILAPVFGRKVMEIRTRRENREKVLQWLGKEEEFEIGNIIKMKVKERMEFGYGKVLGVEGSKLLIEFEGSSIPISMPKESCERAYHREKELRELGL